MKFVKLLIILMLNFVCIISINYSNTKNDDHDKVHFESVNNIENESFSDITNIYNKDNKTTKIFIQLSNNFKDFFEKPSDNLSLNETQKLIRKQRKKVKEYYSSTNTKILKNLKLDLLNINYYVDSYAPFVIGEFTTSLTELDVANIYKLSETKLIENIYVKNVVKPNVELINAISSVEATTIVNNSSTNGSGVVVGILDVGIIDIKNSNFKNVNLKVRDELNYNETVCEHATQVASVASSMAPGVSILSAEVFGSLNGEIGWLLDNGVNVVNMSFGYINNDALGNYTSDSAYIDSIARDNWVTFVGSAGNRGKTDFFVTPPNGYNMLTIGSCTLDAKLSTFFHIKKTLI